MENQDQIQDPLHQAYVPPPATTGAPHPFPLPSEPQAKSRWTPSWMKIGFLLTLLILIPVGLFVLGKNHTKKVAVVPSPPPVASPTPTPDPTVGWSVYNGDGYSIKYLPTWTVDESTAPGYVNINSNDKFPKAPNDPEATTYWVSLKKFSNPNNLSFKDLVTTDLPSDLKVSFKYTTETINKLTIYRTTNLPSMSGGEWVFFKNPEGNDYFSVSFFIYDKEKPFENQEKYYSIFNQMLSTFKFTDSVASNQTASWKPYTSSKLSFKYPENYKVQLREADYIVISPLSAVAATAGISIDARQTGANSNYQTAVSAYKQNLTNPTETNYKNGVKISGKVGPGFGEGTQVTGILLPYQNGAIVIESSDSSVSPDFFDQFASNVIINP